MNAGDPSNKSCGDDEQAIIALTQKLLDSIADGDWDTYSELCDPTLTCFEPEARGQLVHGMEFHQFYFDDLSHRMAVNTTITAPHVRFPADDVAIISYIRLQQRMATDGTPGTSRSEETRVWHRSGSDERWKLVHLHRSVSE